MNIVRCTKCGTLYQDGRVDCKNCGAPYEERAEKPAIAPQVGAASAFMWPYYGYVNGGSGQMGVFHVPGTDLRVRAYVDYPDGGGVSGYYNGDGSYSNPPLSPNPPDPPANPARVRDDLRGDPPCSPVDPSLYGLPDIRAYSPLTFGVPGAVKRFAQWIKGAIGR